MFSATSRYAGVPEAIAIDDQGREIPYKLLRLIPDAPAFQAVAVRQGDRLDLLAAQFYEDPEQYWRIADANRALEPGTLVAEPGRLLAIPRASR